jgi:hypothetical protein
MAAYPDYYGYLPLFANNISRLFGTPSGDQTIFNRDVTLGGKLFNALHQCLGA